MRKKVQPLKKEITNTYSQLEYLLYTITYHGAPTLMKQKTASLITFSASKQNLQAIWQRYKGCLDSYLDLSYIELNTKPQSTIVLFYQPDELAGYLNDPAILSYLQSCGYPVTTDLATTLLHLKQRFKGDCPHEIGLFLGYPLSDVIAFSTAKGQSCLCSGYWKVYSDHENALQVFNRYDLMRKKAVSFFEQGFSPLECAKLCPTH